VTEPLLVAPDCPILPAMACRHGLIAGATGTGKTVTLQRIVEGFSRLAVPEAFPVEFWGGFGAGGPQRRGDSAGAASL
jgi:hypothetical protein